MSVREIIDDVKKTLPPSAVIDQGKSCEEIIKADRVVFLDTCFLSHFAKIDKDARDSVLISINKTDKSSVLVITELVLYEARDPRNNALQPYVYELIESASGLGLMVVVLSEETVPRHFSKFLNRNSEWWNCLFVEQVIKNRMILKKTAGILQSMLDLTDGEFELSAADKRDSSFIEKYMKAIKERKEDKDSLAEQLICVTMFFLLEGFHFSNKGIYFCSVDNGALVSVRKALNSSYDMNQIQFENIHLFSLLQYMVQTGIVKNKKQLLSYMRKTLANPISVVERKELLFQEAEESLTLEQIADGMFDGKTYQYRGKG